MEEEADQDGQWDSTCRDNDIVDKEEQGWTERENGTVFVIPTTPRTPEGQSRWEYLKGGDQDCTSLGWMSELQDGDTTTLGSSSEDTLSHDLERVSLGSLGKWTWDIHSIIIDLSTTNFTDTVAIKTMKNVSHKRPNEFKNNEKQTLTLELSTSRGGKVMTNIIYIDRFSRTSVRSTWTST